MSTLSASYATRLRRSHAANDAVSRAWRLYRTAHTACFRGWDEVRSLARVFPPGRRPPEILAEIGRLEAGLDRLWVTVERARPRVRRAIAQARTCALKAAG